MNRLNYASTLLCNATSLLTALSADVEKCHFGAVMGAIQQLELIHEAICLKGSTRSASEALQIDVISMLGDDAIGMNAFTLLDDYVSVRLGSVASAVLSVQSRYLDTNDEPLTMIGNSMFEAKCWIGAASYAVNAELTSSLGVRMAA